MDSSETAGWVWADVDPLMRSVVAAFSGRIGDETAGDLSGDGFIGAMTESFKDMTTEDIIKVAGWGPNSLRNTIVNHLSIFKPQPVLAMTEQLGRLAGGSEAMLELAAQAGQQLTIGRKYEAIPALNQLSELAVSHLKISGPQA